MLKRIFFLLGAVISLTSCLDITDNITVKKNGSGTYNRVVDFSQLMESIASFSEDNDTTLNQTKHSLDSTMQSQFEFIKNTAGIKNATLNHNAEKSIYTFSFEFANFNQVNSIFSKIAGLAEHQPFEWKKGKIALAGGIPGYIDAKTPEMGEEDISMMSTYFGEADYHLTMSFPKKVKSSSNSKFKVEETKKLVLVSNFGDILTDPSISKTSVTYK